MNAAASLALTATDGNGALVLLTGISRLLGYLGFVLVVGTTFFLSWLWPAASVELVFIRLFHGGAALLFITAAATAIFSASGSMWDAFAGLPGAATLVRMAAIALGVAFSWDVLATPHRWRALIVIWQLVIIATFVVDSDAWTAPWQAVKAVAATAHLSATAAWLGGLLALAAILLPGAHLEVLHDILPRFSRVAVVCVVTLTVSGVLHALAVAGSLSALATTSFGAVLLVKVIVFGVMLLLGNVGRRYAARLAHRKVTEIDESASERSVSAFAVAIGAEFALATAVLAATAALVTVVPTG